VSLSVAPTRVALRVVVVDDRAERRALILLALRGPDADAVHVSEAEDGAAAMQMIESDGADIVLIVVKIQGAIALIGSLRGRYPQ